MGRGINQRLGEFGLSKDRIKVNTDLAAKKNRSGNMVLGYGGLTLFCPGGVLSTFGKLVWLELDRVLNRGPLRTPAVPLASHSSHWGHSRVWFWGTFGLTWVAKKGFLGRALEGRVSGHCGGEISESN